jgi:hypothetical protein
LQNHICFAQRLSPNLKTVVKQKTNFIQQLRVSYNKRLDALAKSACNNITPDYEFGKEVNLTKLNNTFYRFYNLIETIEFKKIDDLPMRFLGLLEENNINIGGKQKDFVKNWDHHSRNIDDSKAVSDECEKEEHLKVSWDYKMNHFISQIPTFVKVITDHSTMQKQKLLLSYLLLSIQNKLATRNDKPSTAIYNNIDELLGVIYLETIDLTFSLIAETDEFEEEKKFIKYRDNDLWGISCISCKLWGISCIHSTKVTLNQSNKWDTNIYKK